LRRERSVSRLGWQVLAAGVGLWVGLVVLAYFFVDWTALIPVASFGLAGILLFVAVAFHPGDDG
jgi:hypothetical protein